MKVRKAIIPAAGLGTRFLPATKSVAKEMLPIVDKPTIHYIVQEAIDSGIEEIMIITGKNKREIEDYFDSNMELEINLKEKNKLSLLAQVNQSTNLRVHFIRQSYPLGLGHAVLQAKAFVGDEPFVVMLGDDVMTDEIPLTKQLINRYEETKSSVLAVMPVAKEETDKYGIVDPNEVITEGLMGVNRFVEKPKPEEAPSNYAIIGRYLLKAEIFEILENQEPGAGNEIQLTDAIDELNKMQRVFAHVFNGSRYDVGDKLGMAVTNIEFGLKHPEIGEGLKEYIIQMGEMLKS